MTSDRSTYDPPMIGKKPEMLDLNKNLFAKREDDLCNFEM